MTRPAFISLLLLLVAADVLAQERKRPQRPNFSANCSRFSMEYDEETNRWKCIFEKPLKRNYRDSKTPSTTRPQTIGGGADDGGLSNEQAQRSRQLQAEQEQRTRQLETEQKLRADQQRRYTDELIREIQQRSRR